MLNMIKMDLYRMFRTKSMYIVWTVLAVAVLFTTFMCKTDYDSLSKEDAVQQDRLAEPTAVQDYMNILRKKKPQRSFLWADSFVYMLQLVERHLAVRC